MKAILLLFMFAAPVLAQEYAKPDAPVSATITEYRIIRFAQQREPDWRFTIVYRDNNGKEYSDEHFGLSETPDPANPGGPPITNPNGADKFLKQMNTMNFSTTSMVRRLLQHLEDHGKIPPSTVQGTPDSFSGDAFAVPIKPKPATAKPPVKK